MSELSPSFLSPDLSGGTSIDVTRPIHVMHVIDKLSVGGSLVHGIGKAIEWWIPLFKPSQFTFSVVSLRSPEPFGKVFEQQGTRIDFLDKGKFDVTTLTALMRLIREQKVDVLHLHGFGSSNFGRLAGWLTNVPSIVHEHCVLDNQPFYQTIADKLLARLSGTSIAVSQRVAQYMTDRRSIKASTIHTFFYGLPLAEFTTPNADVVNQFRQSMKIPEGQLIVGSLGRLDTQKGIIYLLQAAVQILKVRSDVTFIIAGEGPGRESLEAFVDANSLRNNVIFTGFRSDVAVVMAACDVIAIPSLWEGGPITLFEAMCLGKAVVGTPVGVIDEVLVDGESGFVVPCKDPEALAERLQRLLSDETLKNTIGRNAQQTVQAYDVSETVTRLASIYTDVVSTR